MIPHKQLNGHNPEAGEIGDCFRTVIACLLDMRPEEVPHFFDYCRTDEDSGDLGWDRALMFLHERGLHRFSFHVNSMEDVKMLSETNPDCYMLLTGLSRNGVNHVVIYRNGQIAHDPSKNDSGIVGPCMGSGFYMVTLIVPLQMTVLNDI